VKGIPLFRLNDALETDWRALIGSDAWSSGRDLSSLVAVDTP
jgi:hypothetical protein